MALILVSSSANATGFSIMGNVDFFNISSSPTASGTSAKLGFGGGVGVDFSMGSSVSLEIDALYDMRKNGATILGVDFSQTYTSLTFPVFARIWLSPNFNFIAGGFYGMAMGDIKQEVAGVSSTQTYAAANAKTSDYGAVVGLGMRTGSGLFIDARYYLGLANLVATPTTGVLESAKSSMIQANIGYHFGGKK